MHKALSRGDRVNQPDNHFSLFFPRKYACRLKVSGETNERKERDCIRLRKRGGEAGLAEGIKMRGKEREREPGEKND